MAEPLRHRQTKEAATDMFSLQPPRHIYCTIFDQVQRGLPIGPFRERADIYECYSTHPARFFSGSTFAGDTG